MTNKVKKKFLCIDGDLVAYPAAAAHQTVYHIAIDPELGIPLGVSRSIRQLKEAFGKKIPLDHHVVANPFEFVRKTIDQTLTNIYEATGVRDYEIYLSDGETFRHKLATVQKYKGNRDKQIRPIHLNKAKDYLREVWGAKSRLWLEADDLISMKVNELAESEEFEGVTVSYDKDLDQISGWHFDFNKGDLYHVDKQHALRCLYKQVLMGDAADNIQGVPGIGKVRAEKILGEREVHDLPGVVLSYYHKEFGAEEGKRLFEENLALVSLIRDEEEYQYAVQKAATTLSE